LPRLRLVRGAEADRVRHADYVAKRLARDPDFAVELAEAKRLLDITHCPGCGAPTSLRPEDEDRVFKGSCDCGTVYFGNPTGGVTAGTPPWFWIDGEGWCR